MSKSPTTIELNGKRYDARTGVIVSERNSEHDSNFHHSTDNKSEHSPTPVQSSGQNLDGFVRRSSVEKPQVSKTKPHHLKRTAQKSNTLMRPVVKKPDIPKPDVVRRKSPKLVPAVNHARIARAENVTRSPHVSKFGKSSQLIKKEAHLPVMEPSLSAIGKGVTNELHKLEVALQDANSHLHQLEEGAIKKVPFLQRVGFKNKFANITAMSFAALLLVGFFAYQNQAQVSVRIASAKAGVQANVPSYQPPGFSLDKNVEYSPGKVAIKFKSRTDDRSFTLNQQSSSWSSASLLANYVDRNNCDGCYQTWQNDGKTVYTYDQSNATWVDGGVWYLVEGESKLTSDQLLELASSL